MTENDKASRRKLPPMSALEDAIRRTFRNLGFFLRLLIVWAVVIALFAAGPVYLLKDVAPADLGKLPPAKMAMLVGLGLVLLLAYLSIMVNWQRRQVLGETPKGWLWLRLDAPVWRYLGNLVVFFVVIGIIGGAVGLALVYGPGLLPQLGPAAKPAANGVAVLIGIFGLLAWQRLSIKFPAIAAGRRDYTFLQAWRDTRGNTLRFLAFDFWFAFTLAICGALGFAASKAPSFIASPYALPCAITLIGILGFFGLVLTLTVASSFYSFWGEKRDFPKPN